MASEVIHTPPPLHGPEAKRPKGILKNSSSYNAGSASTPNPISPIRSPKTSAETGHTTIAVPPLPTPLDERELVLENTLRNAGPRRRSSSNTTRQAAGSRRHSTTSQHGHEDGSPSNSPRLKWDEANLYLTEQERTPKMKIDEPKTPFAKRYDPAEDLDDAEELTMLDAGEIKVDELENGMKRFKSQADTEIPELELGEGAWTEEDEKAERERRGRSHSPKVVHVAEEAEKKEEEDGGESKDELAEKHRKFEEMRKKHYEMREVANLLGHPEIVDEEEDDEDQEMKDAPNGVPPVPKLPNGEKS